MKKIISLLLSLTMLLSIVSVVDFSAYADTLTTGKCGKNVTYSFDAETGVLTISGEGDMENYNYENNPFYKKSNIKTVIIKNGVTSIGDWVFYNCSSLTSITIPNSVTSIGNWVFRDCTSLTSVAIPTSVTSIGDGVFYCCESLTSIEVSNNNENYSSTDGVLFNKNKSELITYPAGKTDSEYAIPNSVTSIGSYAFFDCESLTSVTIPNSVTNIGVYAFYGCKSLTSVTIPDSVISIGDYAFYGCKSLTSVTIPDSVISIGDYAFSYCESLTSVTIPNSVTSICSDAFSDCTSLKSIEVSDNNKNYSSVDGVLFNKDKSELITYPASKTDNTYEIPNSVTSIDNEAFYYCKSLASVTIPDSVTSIDFSAFGNCANLNFIIYNGTKLQWNAINISSCNENLKNAIIKCTDGLIENGNTVTIDNLEYKLNDDDTAQIIGYMGESENITIPESISYEGYTFTVTSIGDSVFSNCDNLISVTIPNSVKRLGDNAFGSVKKVIYNGTDKEFFEIENIENNKNVIVAKYYDLLNDLISEIEVPYKQSEYLKITDDYLYNTIKDRINNNEEAVSKKILIKNGEFYINGMDIGELKVQYVYFPQHYDDLNGNIERLHKVYCYIYDESSWSSSSYSLDVKVKFINDSDYNKADEKYVSDFIKTLNIAKPQCYEVDYEEYKMSEIGDWKYHFSVASEYYNKLINDSSIKFVAGSGAGGYSSFLNPYFGEAGVDLAVFKNDVLYGTYYPITNYKDGVKVTGEKIIPVMTLPSDLPDNQVENYILQKLKNDWKNESHTILSVKKGAVVNGSQLKDGYMIKIAPGYHEGDYGIIIARKQNNSTSDEKPTPVPTPSPTQQVTQPTAQNDTATTSQVKKAVSKPKSTNTKKVKAAKKAISVKWKKVRGVKGYQVQVATDKKFKKNKKTVTIKKQKTTKTTVKKLKAKKKYYVRVRTYIIVNGKKVYSSWSKIKTVKTK
ncbi:cell surface protein [Firmicutes bacterium CAG:341]|nr:cell surface protein [Firmicutes bacterium CAG:341]